MRREGRARARLRHRAQAAVARAAAGPRRRARARAARRQVGGARGPHARHHTGAHAYRHIHTYACYNYGWVTYR